MNRKHIVLFQYSSKRCFRFLGRRVLSVLHRDEDYKDLVFKSPSTVFNVHEVLMENFNFRLMSTTLCFKVHGTDKWFYESIDNIQVVITVVTKKCPIIVFCKF